MFLNIVEFTYKNYLNYLSSEPTWSPPITRSKRKGMMAKKSTRFMGCLKNLHFLGEQTNLTIYSITKNMTAQFSDKNKIKVTFKKNNKSKYFKVTRIDLTHLRPPLRGQPLDMAEVVLSPPPPRTLERCRGRMWRLREERHQDWTRQTSRNYIFIQSLFLYMCPCSCTVRIRKPKRIDYT